MNKKLIPLVSIIIPTYNHSTFLSKALNSIVKQTYEKWEAIIIDNYSTDDTQKIVNRYNDKRFKYLKIENNGVIAKSRNFGIQNAQGEWIAFLDSDDWWTTDKLQLCVSNINNEVDFIYHALEINYYKYPSYLKKNSLQGRQLNKPILLDLLLGGIKKGNAIGNSSVVVRKNILSKIGGINENKKLVGSEDYNTWLRIAQITDKFKYFENKLGYNLIHDGGVSKKDMSIPQREAVAEFMKLFNTEQKTNLEVKLRYISGNYNYLKNNYIDAKENFMFVLRNGLLNLKLRSLFKIIVMMIKSILIKNK